MAALVQVLCQHMHDLSQDALARPFLEIAMARLVGRVVARQGIPLGARAKNPQDSVEHLARVLARSAPTIPAPPIVRQQRLDELPLGIRDVHSDIP